MLLTAQPQGNNVSSVPQTNANGVERAELCIIGDGAVALAAGAILSAGRQNLRVFVVRGKSSSSIQLPLEYELCPRGADAAGQRSKTSFSVVSDNAACALKGADGIVIAAPATEYSAIARQLLEGFRNGQTVYLVNAPLAGGLQFANCVQAIDPDLQLNVLELGNLFDSARIEGSLLLITGSRDKIAVCGNSRNETRRGLAIASSLSKELVPTSNLMERGLADVEKLLRPTILLFALLGARDKNLDCISNIINPNLTKIVVALEEEVQAIAKAFKCVTHTFLETLTDFTGVCWEDADCLDQALISIAPNLIGQSLSAADNIPMSWAIDKLKADSAETLVLLAEFARLSRVPAPVLNSVIDLAQVTTRSDIRRQGRGLHDVGLLGFDVDEIVELINA